MCVACHDDERRMRLAGIVLGGGQGLIMRGGLRALPCSEVMTCEGWGQGVCLVQEHRRHRGRKQREWEWWVNLQGLPGLRGPGLNIAPLRARGKVRSGVRGRIKARVRGWRTEAIERRVGIAGPREDGFHRIAVHMG